MAGIVAAVEAAGGETRYTLEDGRTFTLDGSAASDLVYSKGQAGGEHAGQVVGELMLAGHTAGRAWLALMPPGDLTASYLPPGCYELISRGTDRGDSIETQVGLVIRKAPGFDAGLYPDTPGGYPPTAQPGMRYEGSPQVFCLNEEGLVTAAR